MQILEGEGCCVQGQPTHVKGNTNEILDSIPTGVGSDLVPEKCCFLPTWILEHIS